MTWSKIKLIIFSIIASLFIGINISYADEIDNVFLEQNVIMQEINIQQQVLDKLSDEYNEAIIEKQEAENKIENIEQQIQETELNLQNTQYQLKKQVIDKYKNKNLSFIDVLLESNNFYNFSVTLDFYNKIMNNSNQIIQTNKNLKMRLADQKNELENQKSVLEQKISEIESSKIKADNIITDLQNKYESLDQEIVKMLIQQQMNINLNDIPLDTNIEFSNNSDFANYVVQTITANSNISTSDMNDIVARAYSMLGSPYSWGGTTSAGFDCSGFVSYCLTGQEGVRLGTTGTFIGWEQVSDPQPGDVCVIHNGNSQHTGIYIGDGKMIHSATYGVGVVESNVQSGMTYVRYN